MNKKSIENDALSKEKTEEFLLSETHKINLIVLDKTDSTNIVAKNLIRENPEEIFAVLAKQQTNGRGRLSKSFFSPENTGIYLSIAVPFKNEGEPFSLITVRAAVAVCLVIEKLTFKKPQIKWVNDIYLNSKKICGILAESVINPDSGEYFAAVIGVGLNFKEPSNGFPKEISEIAGALFNEETPTVSINQMAAGLICGLISPDDKTSCFLDEYRKRCFVIGKNIEYTENNNKYCAEAIGIDNSGCLVVKDSHGNKKILNSGEISIRTV